jgi:hypothetical protein
MHLAYIVLFALALAWVRPVLAHGGGLDANGCHTNRKTGDYHCHRSPTQKPKSGTNDLRRNLDRSAPPAGSAFRNGAAARAAGAAPVRRGDPGYGPHLDRDNDGVGCE